jgi:hypothetical protein
MGTNFIFDKSTEPRQDEILQLLGKSSGLLLELDQFLESEFGNINFNWKFYTKKSGWTRKALLKKRNLFFFTPKENYFSITFVFGDKAVESVENSDLPEDVKTRLREARKYMEGRGICIDVSSNDDLDVVKKLTMIKVAPPSPLKGELPAHIAFYGRKNHN